MKGLILVDHERLFVHIPDPPGDAEMNNEGETDETMRRSRIVQEKTRLSESVYVRVNNEAKITNQFWSMKQK